MSTEREEAWLNAKWGEVWVLTVNGVEHVQRVTRRGDFADLYRDDCGWVASSASITAGRRIWPETTQAPTDDERQTLPVASRDVWGWDTCVVCGSEEVSDRGMVVMGVSAGNPYIARIAWCDQTQECQEDLRQTSFLLTADDVKVIDSSYRPAQGEPTGDVRQTCAWCPGDARGSAWWNDGRLHPSCGQIGHGEGWVPDERAVRPAQGEPTSNTLRERVQELVNNQQSWIDAGRSGQVISRDAMRDVLQRVLDETRDSCTAQGDPSNATQTPVQLHPDPANATEVAREEPTEVDATPDEAWELGRIAGYDEAMREVCTPQGEPTAAQVRAAAVAINPVAWATGVYHKGIPGLQGTSLLLARAALIAAFKEGTQP